MNDSSTASPVRARVTAHLECSLTPKTITIASLVLATGYALVESESLTITLDGEPYEPQEIFSESGARLHRIEAEQGGQLVIDYEATAQPMDLFTEGDPHATGEQFVRFVRPSRYVPSDVLLPSCFGEFPASEFPADNPAALAEAIEEWVNSQIAYVPGSSRFTEDARHTYLSRRGVCRDFAHLVVAFLRSRNIPARVASVYAPGLRPMDFHLVAEGFYDGRWHTFDATRLAEPSTFMRIATGRDATDTAFLTTVGGSLTLKKLAVTADLIGEEPATDASGGESVHSGDAEIPEQLPATDPAAENVDDGSSGPESSQSSSSS